jgi:hypothetical protein
MNGYRLGHPCHGYSTFGVSQTTSSFAAKMSEFGKNMPLFSSSSNNNNNNASTSKEDGSKALRNQVSTLFSSMKQKWGSKPVPTDEGPVEDAKTEEEEFEAVDLND